MTLRLDRKFDRVREAAERAQARAELTPQQQLEVLDKRLGKGQGARKERARLQPVAVTPDPAPTAE